MMKGNLSVSAFLEGVLLCGIIQQLRNLSLLLIRIFSQVPESLVMVHKLPLHHLFIQTNLITRTNDS